MPSRLVLAAIAALALCSSQAFAQSTRPATRPAAVAPPRVTKADVQEVKSGAVSFRAIPAVLDARDRREDWQQAARAAEGSIKNNSLRQQLARRLSGLQPQVTGALKAHPQDEAVVTVAVYRKAREPGKDAMVAVTFDGLGSRIGTRFLPQVLNNLSNSPKGQDIPTGLALDPQASSYLVCFMGNHKLEAGDIPHEQMVRSIVVAANRARENLATDGVQVASRQERAQARQLENQQLAQQARQAAAVRRGTGTAADIRAYDVRAYVAPNDGFYYPGIGVPIVILPNEYPDNTHWRAAQLRRERALEQQYRHAPPQGQTGAAPSAGSGRGPATGPSAPAAGHAAPVQHR